MIVISKEKTFSPNELDGNDKPWIAISSTINEAIKEWMGGTSIINYFSDNDKYQPDFPTIDTWISPSSKVSADILASPNYVLKGDLPEKIGGQSFSFTVPNKSGDADSIHEWVVGTSIEFAAGSDAVGVDLKIIFELKVDEQLLALYLYDKNLYISKITPPASTAPVSNWLSKPVGEVWLESVPVNKGLQDLGAQGQAADPTQPVPPNLVEFYNVVIEMVQADGTPLKSVSQVTETTSFIPFSEMEARLQLLQDTGTLTLPGSLLLGETVSPLESILQEHSLLRDAQDRNLLGTTKLNLDLLSLGAPAEDYAAQLNLVGQELNIKILDKDIWAGVREANKIKALEYILLYTNKQIQSTDSMYSDLIAHCIIPPDPATPGVSERVGVYFEFRTTGPQSGVNATPPAKALIKVPRRKIDALKARTAPLDGTSNAIALPLVTYYPAKNLKRDIDFLRLPESKENNFQGVLPHFKEKMFPTDANINGKQVKIGQRAITEADIDNTGEYLDKIRGRIASFIKANYERPKTLTRGQKEPTGEWESLSPEDQDTKREYWRDKDRNKIKRALLSNSKYALEVSFLPNAENKLNIHKVRLVYPKTGDFIFGKNDGGVVDNINEFRSHIIWNAMAPASGNSCEMSGEVFFKRDSEDKTIGCELAGYMAKNLFYHMKTMIYSHLGFKTIQILDTSLEDFVDKYLTYTEPYTIQPIPSTAGAENATESSPAAEKAAASQVEKSETVATARALATSEDRRVTREELQNLPARQNYISFREKWLSSVDDFYAYKQPVEPKRILTLGDAWNYVLSKQDVRSMAVELVACAWPENYLQILCEAALKQIFESDNFEDFIEELTKPKQELFGESVWSTITKGNDAFGETLDAIESQKKDIDASYTEEINKAFNLKEQLEQVQLLIANLTEHISQLQLIKQINGGNLPTEQQAQLTQYISDKEELIGHKDDGQNAIDDSIKSAYGNHYTDSETWLKKHFDMQYKSAKAYESGFNSSAGSLIPYEHIGKSQEIQDYIAKAIKTIEDPNVSRILCELIIGLIPELIGLLEAAIKFNGRGGFGEYLKMQFTVDNPVKHLQSPLSHKIEWNTDDFMGGFKEMITKMVMGMIAGVMLGAVKLLLRELIAQCKESQNALRDALMPPPDDENNLLDEINQSDPENSNPVQDVFDKQGALSSAAPRSRVPTKSLTGLNEKNLEDFEKFIIDMSAILTLKEMCSLLSGTPSDSLLSIIENYIKPPELGGAGAYPNLYANILASGDFKSAIKNIFIELNGLLAYDFCEDVYNTDKPMSGVSEYCPPPAGLIKAAAADGKLTPEQLEAFQKELKKHQDDVFKQALELLVSDPEDYLNDKTPTPPHHKKCPDGKVVPRKTHQEKNLSKKIRGAMYKGVFDSFAGDIQNILDVYTDSADIGTGADGSFADSELLNGKADDLAKLATPILPVLKDYSMAAPFGWEMGMHNSDQAQAQNTFLKFRMFGVDEPGLKTPSPIPGLRLTYELPHDLDAQPAADNSEGMLKINTSQFRIKYLNSSKNDRVISLPGKIDAQESIDENGNLKDFTSKGAKFRLLLQKAWYQNTKDVWEAGDSPFNSNIFNQYIEKFMYSRTLMNLYAVYSKPVADSFFWDSKFDDEGEATGSYLKELGGAFKRAMKTNFPPGCDISDISVDLLELGKFKKMAEDLEEEKECETSPDNQSGPGPFELANMDITIMLLIRVMAVEAIMSNLINFSTYGLTAFKSDLWGKHITSYYAKEIYKYREMQFMAAHSWSLWSTWPQAVFGTCFEICKKRSDSSLTKNPFTGEEYPENIKLGDGTPSIPDAWKNKWIPEFEHILKEEIVQVTHRLNNKWLAVTHETNSLSKIFLDNIGYFEEDANIYNRMPIRYRAQGANAINVGTKGLLLGEGLEEYPFLGIDIFHTFHYGGTPGTKFYLQPYLEVGELKTDTSKLSNQQLNVYNKLKQVLQDSGGKYIGKVNIMEWAAKTKESENDPFLNGILDHRLYWKAEWKFGLRLVYATEFAGPTLIGGAGDDTFGIKAALMGIDAPGEISQKFMNKLENLIESGGDFVKKEKSYINYWGDSDFNSQYAHLSIPIIDAQIPLSEVYEAHSGVSENLTYNFLNSQSQGINIFPYSNLIKQVFNDEKMDELIGPGSIFDLTEIVGIKSIMHHIHFATRPAKFGGTDLFGSFNTTKSLLRDIYYASQTADDTDQEPEDDKIDLGAFGNFAAAIGAYPFDLSKLATATPVSILHALAKMTDPMYATMDWPWTPLAIADKILQAKAGKLHWWDKNEVPGEPKIINCPDKLDAADWKPIGSEHSTVPAIYLSDSYNPEVELPPLDDQVEAMLDKAQEAAVEALSLSGADQGWVTTHNNWVTQLEGTKTPFVPSGDTGFLEATYSIPMFANKEAVSSLSLEYKFTSLSGPFMEGELFAEAVKNGHVDQFAAPFGEYSTPKVWAPLKDSSPAEHLKASGPYSLTYPKDGNFHIPTSLVIKAIIDPDPAFDLNSELLDIAPQEISIEVPTAWGGLLNSGLLNDPAVLQQWNDRHPLPIGDYTGQYLPFGNLGSGYSSHFAGWTAGGIDFDLEACLPYFPLEEEGVKQWNPDAVYKDSFSGKQSILFGITPSIKTQTNLVEAAILANAAVMPYPGLSAQALHRDLKLWIAQWTGWDPYTAVGFKVIDSESGDPWSGAGMKSYVTTMDNGWYDSVHRKYIDAFTVWDDTYAGMFGTSVKLFY